MRAVPRLGIIIYTPAFALQLRKNHGKTCHGSRKVPNSAVLDAIGGRFMGYLDWPAKPSSNLESKLSVRALMWSAKYGLPISVNWPVTDVPRCTRSNAKHVD
jgi:hypothetical protein